MTRLPSFPTPYPDECTYSILCRYFVRSGETNKSRVLNTLFGRRLSLIHHVLWPVTLEMCNRWFGPENGLFLCRMLALDHSCISYMSVTFGDDLMASTAAMLEGTSPDFGAIPNSRLRRRGIVGHSLRFCPVCVLEDIAAFGEPYWHRLCQLPGIHHCPTHGVLLHDSPVSSKRSYTVSPASFVLTHTADLSVQRFFSPHEDRYDAICKDTQWLLSRGLELGGLSRVKAAYVEELDRKNLISAKCKICHKKLEQELIDYHGESFLRELFHAPPTLNPAGWIRQLTYGRRISPMKSIHHILVIQLLFGSVEAFHERMAQDLTQIL